MKELTTSQKRFERIMADLAIIRWMLALNIVGLLILFMVNG